MSAHDESRVYARHQRRNGAVLIIGAGAVGGFVAEELARVGISPLYLVDRDVLEIENIVRHPLGAWANGRPKASALAQKIVEDFPLCDAVGLDLDFLDLSFDEQLSLVGGFDLVVAATDRFECQHAINVACFASEVTGVYPGVWVDSRIRDAEVGEVLWVLAGRHTPCFDCAVSWRQTEPDAQAGRGARIDIQLLSLVTAQVVTGLVDRSSPSAALLDLERTCIYVHGFTRTSAGIRDAFPSDGLRNRAVRVPLPRWPCPTCGLQEIPASQTVAPRLNPVIQPPRVVPSLRDLLPPSAHQPPQHTPLPTQTPPPRDRPVRTTRSGRLREGRPTYQPSRDNSPSKTRTAPPPRYAPPPRQRRGRRWLLGAAAVGVAIAVIQFYLTHRHNSPQYLASDFQTHDAYVTDIAFSSDIDPDFNTYLIASSGADGAFYWSAISGDGAGKLGGLNDACGGVAVTPDNAQVIGGCGTSLYAETIGTQVLGDGVDGTTSGSVNDIVLSPTATSKQGGPFAVATSKGAELWAYTPTPQNGTNITEKMTLQPGSSVSNVAYSPNGQLLAGVSDGTPGTTGTIRIWNSGTGQLQTSFTVPYAFQVAFSPDGSTMAISTLDGIEFRNMTSGAMAIGIKYGAYDSGGMGPGGAIAYAPNGTLLAFANGWDHIGLWDVAQKMQVGSLPTSAGGQGYAYALAFSPNNLYLASAGGATNCDGSCDDDSVHLWDVGTFTGVQSTG